jgi:hypothetical protein
MVDGHCATDAETVYVQNTSNCTNTTAGGSSTTPFCLAQAGISSAKTNNKPLVVMIGTLAAGFNVSTTVVLTVVGKSAVITPGAGSDAITITAGEIYLRNLTVQGSTTLATGMGINATAGTTLHIDSCAVINNPGGGILLNGAAFSINNTTVTGNGPGTSPVGASYGGIRVEALPASGSATLDLVTIQNNKQVGLSCSGAITGIGVLANGNVGGVDIGSTCAITACTPASTTCGVQSQPQ